MDRPEWSNKQLRKLGEFLRDGIEPPHDALSYDEVRRHYSNVAEEVQREIQRLEWRPLLGRREFEVTSRAKTIDTVREKLNRDRSTPLSSIQDIAGVRFEAEMSLSQQQAVAEAISQRFDSEIRTSLHDLRKSPNSGYRALHVWLRLPQRVEVQVRTHLQGEWANVYEEAGDYFGREIRYGAEPREAEKAHLVRKLQLLSLNHISAVEQLRERLLEKELGVDEAVRAMGLRDRVSNDRDVGGRERGAVKAGLEREYQDLRTVERKLIEEMRELRSEVRKMAIQGGME